MKQLQIAFIFFTFYSVLLSAQEDFKTIHEGVMEMKLTSENTGNSYNIKIGLPFGYDRNEKSYPVLYALDGNVTFGMVNDITKLLSFENAKSSVIVVGINYNSFSDWISKRNIDYMPSQESTAAIDKYLAFISKELIPLINKKFRTQPKENTIYGHSSGGVLGFYSLFKQPEVFKNYILTSPSIDEDGGYTINLEKNIDEKEPSLGVKLYTAIGENEKQSFREVYDSFCIKLKKHKSIENYNETIKGTHMSVMAPAFINGFQYIFKK